MSELLAGILVIAAMLAPYVLVAALTAAFPGLRRGMEDMPRTDEVVARFFDRTIPGRGRPFDGTEIQTPVEDRPSWSSVGIVRRGAP
jgi:hypothetical protein